MTAISSNEMHGVAIIIILLCVCQIVLCVTTGTPTNPTVLYRTPREGKEFSSALLAKGNLIVVGGRDFFSQLWFSNTSSQYNETTRIHTTDVKGDATKIKQCKEFLATGCDNNIQVLKFASERRLLVCGASANSAKCAYYHLETGVSKELKIPSMERWMSGTSNMITHLCDNDSERSFYVASKDTSVGTFRRVLPTALRTPDNAFLDVEFKAIYEFERKNFVYVLFNEKSSSFSGDKFVSESNRYQHYSMIARVCKNDNGGSVKTEEWVTLNKLRLLCPSPGKLATDLVNFYYDEMVTTFQNANTIYALFRPNRNWGLSSYAVARYDIRKIDEYFDGTVFNDNSTHYYNKNNPDVPLKYRGGDPPFYPGQCPTSIPYSLGNGFEVFVTTKTLIRGAVKPIDKKAIYVGEEDVNYEFIFASDVGASTTVILLSRDGHMKKIVVTNNKPGAEIFNKRVIENEGRILNAKLVEEKAAIVAVTPGALVSIPLSFCEDHRDCNSCMLDPHCRWIADSDNAGFSCTRSVTVQKTVTKTCPSAPPPPTNVRAVVQAGEVRVSWDAVVWTGSPFYVVTISSMKTKEVVFRLKTSASPLPVSKAYFTAGCIYAVTVASLNKYAMSSDVNETFHIALDPPTVTHRQVGGIVSIEWRPVPGASRYKVQSFDSDGKILQDVSFRATESVQTFYQPYATSYGYTVTVTAESGDSINSTATVVISPHTSPSGTTQSTKQSHANTEQPTSTATTEVTPPRPMFKARPVLLVVTSTPDDSARVEESDSSPAPEYMANKDDASDIFDMRNQSVGVTIGLLVFVFLFILTFSIIVYNFFVIRSAKSKLKDNEDYEYILKWLVLWKKKDKRCNSPCLKFDGAVNTSSNA